MLDKLHLLSLCLKDGEMHEVLHDYSETSASQPEHADVILFAHRKVNATCSMSRSNKVTSVSKPNGVQHALLSCCNSQHRKCSEHLTDVLLSN